MSIIRRTSLSAVFASQTCHAFSELNFSSFKTIVGTLCVRIHGDLCSLLRRVSTLDIVIRHSKRENCVRLTVMRGKNMTNLHIIRLWMMMMAIRTGANMTDFSFPYWSMDGFDCYSTNTIYTHRHSTHEPKHVVSTMKSLERIADQTTKAHTMEMIRMGLRQRKLWSTSSSSSLDVLIIEHD